MFRLILVPLDGSAESEVALSPARTLAVALGAEILLLRVFPSENSTLEIVSSEATREAHRYLDGIASTLDVSPVKTEVVVSEGEPADAVAREAQTCGADLIVMATHGRHGLKRLLVGSVAHGVLSRSHVPVMLVGPGNTQMRHLRLILVPLDGSPDSYLALSFAIRLARANPAAIALLRVVVPLPLWIYDPTLGLNTGPLLDLRWDEHRRQSADNESRRGAVRALLSSAADGVVRAAHQPVLLVSRDMQRAGGIDMPAYAGVPTQRDGAQHRLHEKP